MEEGATVGRGCGLSESGRFHSVEESSFSCRVIGNVDDILITVTKKKTKKTSSSNIKYSQLQKSQVCKTVVGPVLTLLLYVVLKNRDGLRVITIETGQDPLYVLGSGRSIEGHLYNWRKLWWVGWDPVRRGCGKIMKWGEGAIWLAMLRV